MSKKPKKSSKPAKKSSTKTAPKKPATPKDRTIKLTPATDTEVTAELRKAGEPITFVPAVCERLVAVRDARMKYKALESDSITTRNALNRKLDEIGGRPGKQRETVSDQLVQAMRTIDYCRAEMKSLADEFEVAI